MLEPGRNEIALEGVSNHLDANSLRIEGSGDATILSVNYQNNYLNEHTASPEEKHLQTELDTLQAHMEHIQNQHAALDEELEVLKANYKIPASNQSSFVDELEDAADFYRKRVADTRDLLTQVMGKEKILGERIKKLNEQINTIKNKNDNPGGQIVVVLTANSAGAADIEFSYYVSGASWHPVYTLRAGKQADNVAMDYNAMVSQTTGENWKDVKLTLSTANPMINNNPPKLETVYTQPLQMDANVSIKGSRAGSTQYYIDGVKAPEYKNMQTVETSVQQNMTSTSFEISMNYTIPSDGVEKSITIQQYTLPAQFSYLAVPKLSTDAFLQAKITNWESYNLLPGEANLFVDNAYSGKSYLNPAVTEDTLDLSFGVDKKINIKRTRVKDYSKKQFIGSNRIDEYGFEISVRNTKTTAINIRVEDQVPVSTSKEVIVELGDNSGAKYDPVTGKLSWELSIAPNEEKKLNFSFTIKHPKNWVIPNL
jgi:uncharacterized protein (TIGR02231 family)